jgi:CubicO group peptidase (beta-lactamase class C family)
VVERLSGQSLGRFLDERIFRPLGMPDTGFNVPASKARRYAKALPTDPNTGQPQQMADYSKPIRFECGGGCAVSTVADYLRFAQMLANKGTLDGRRILGRKTVEYMTTDQLGPDIRNNVGLADPPRVNYGFGLGVAVRKDTGGTVMNGSPGEFAWPGASGTNFWVDPKEELVVVMMAQTPGSIRWHYRQVISALVLQALQ